MSFQNFTAHPPTFCQSLADKCIQKYFNSNDYTSMEMCYLSSQCFEPRSLKPTLLYPLTIVYALILISGIAGNLITCLVIVRSNYCLLQTTTNRYLLNLALADLVGLISGIPFEIYSIWNQYPWHPPDFVCHSKAWISEMTSYVSVLTIVTFSIERHLAICHSFVMTKLSSTINRHLAKFLFVLWLVAGICAAPYGIYHRADYVLNRWPSSSSTNSTFADRSRKTYGPLVQTKMCMLAIAFDPSLKPFFQILFHCSAIAFFFLPLLVLICLYGKVGWAVKSSRRTLNSYHKERQQQSNLISSGGGADGAAGVIDRKSSTNTNASLPSSSAPVVMVSSFSTKQDYDSKKVLTILVAVVVTFFICYAPYQAQRLLFFYIRDPYTHQAINTYLFTISGILFYLSSILNPILYNVISARYRRAFKEVLCRLFSNSYELEQQEKCRRFHSMNRGSQLQNSAIVVSNGGLGRMPSWSSSQWSVVKSMMTLNNSRNGPSVLLDSGLPSKTGPSPKDPLSPRPIGRCRLVCGLVVKDKENEALLRIPKRIPVVIEEAPKKPEPKSPSIIMS